MIAPAFLEGNQGRRPEYECIMPMGQGPAPVWIKGAWRRVRREKGKTKAVEERQRERLRPAWAGKRGSEHPEMCHVLQGTAGHRS